MHRVNAAGIVGVKETVEKAEEAVEVVAQISTGGGREVGRVQEMRMTTGELINGEFQVSIPTLRF